MFLVLDLVLSQSSINQPTKTVLQRFILGLSNSELGPLCSDGGLTTELWQSGAIASLGRNAKSATGDFLSNLDIRNKHTELMQKRCSYKPGSSCRLFFACMRSRMHFECIPVEAGEWFLLCKVSIDLWRHSLMPTAGLGDKKTKQKTNVN